MADSSGLCLRDVFDLAAETERNGRTFYAAAAEAASDPEVQRIMRRLGEAEAEHEAAFRRMREAACPPPPEGEAGEAAPEAISDEQREYLRALLASRALPDLPAALRAVAEMTDDGAALDFAIAFEKDTILFMHHVQEMLPEADREAMARLIQQEHIHVRLLQQFKDMRR